MLLGREHLYSGKIVDLVVDRVEIEGREYVREVVRHPGGVAVLAQLQDGRIPFVRQHRYPMDRSLLELPAGKLDPGEEPVVGARRELEEETGYRAARIQHVMNFYPTPGFCDELLHLFYCDRPHKRTPCREEDERIEVELYRLEEALEMIRGGDIVDAKTLVGIYWRYWKEKG